MYLKSVPGAVRCFKPSSPTVCILLFTLISLLLAACGHKKEEKPKNPPAVVDVTVVQPQQLVNYIELSGSVASNESVELHPEISGRLTYLNLQEGSQVKVGTIIAKINDADLRGQLQKSEAQLRLANTTVARLKKLLDIKGINQADYDEAVGNQNDVKADIAVTQAQLDKTVIRAPFSGRLGLRRTSPGAYVTPADVVIALNQDDRLKVDFTVPENYTHLIVTGNRIKVLVTGAKDTAYAVVIASEANVNADSRNLTARAVLQTTSVKPGAFAKVYVDAGSQETALMIPTNAIIPDATANKVVLVTQGKAKFVPVETGIRKISSVQVTRGVKKGDTLVVAGVLFTKPNGPVKIKTIRPITELTKEP